ALGSDVCVCRRVCRTDHSLLAASGTLRGCRLTLRSTHTLRRRAFSRAARAGELYPFVTASRNEARAVHLQPEPPPQSHGGTDIRWPGGIGGGVWRPGG